MQWSSWPKSNCGAWLPAFRRRLGPERRPLSRCRWGWRAIGGRVGRLVGEALHVLFERLIAFGDPLLVGVLQSPFLLEDK